MCVILLTRKEAIVIIWLNRDNHDHVLIIRIDIDVESQRTNDQDDFFWFFEKSWNPRSVFVVQLHYSCHLD
jgi:hypothetical protein